MVPRIPKPDGKQRPLGIPTIKDRVVQTALLIVLEPIFEADLQPEQHAYRAERSALDAVQAVHSLLNTGYTEVVDADLSGYFDSRPTLRVGARHAELMQCVARRISDKAVLHLIKLWLVAAVEEKDARGNVHRTTRNKDEGRGTPPTTLRAVPGTALALALELVHAAIRARLEDVGTRTGLASSDRELCR